jgi:hypothetical protein
LVNDVNIYVNDRINQIRVDQLYKLQDRIESLQKMNIDHTFLPSIKADIENELERNLDQYLKLYALIHFSKPSIEDKEQVKSNESTYKDLSNSNINESTKNGKPVKDSVIHEQITEHNVYIGVLERARAFSEKNNNDTIPDALDGVLERARAFSDNPGEVQGQFESNEPSKNNFSNSNIVESTKKGKPIEDSVIHEQKIEEGLEKMVPLKKSKVTKRSTVKKKLEKSTKKTSSKERSLSNKGENAESKKISRTNSRK